jgi:hypothetical protein
MVDLGARLTGTEAHDRFCTWLENEMAAAGLELLPPDEYRYDRWLAERIALDVFDGDEVRPVEVATAYVRSASTPREGITGPLVFVGAIPPVAPAVRRAAGDSGVPPQVQAWADQLPADLAGTIAVAEVTVPIPLNARGFTAAAGYLHWPGHNNEEWSAIDYRRPWIGPWPELTVFEQLGVTGVVFIADASREMLAGNYSPHVGRRQPVPALVVDRDTGTALRDLAAGRPTARLTLHAPTTPVRLRSVTAVLPGASDEVIVVNSHSDGQNAFEENGSAALVALARHFASLPPDQRLGRTLVFASWPGHMSGEEGIEDASCWIAAHPDLSARAAAAVTIEHLGATEWVETSDSAYSPTGENELYAIWTTEGRAAELATAALVDANLHRHAVLKPARQITPGAPFHDSGIPHVSGIAGPPYLLVVSEGGEMDKFDEQLAARQIGFYADVIRRLDAVPVADLRGRDPSLGANPPSYTDGRIQH